MKQLSLMSILLVATLCKGGRAVPLLQQWMNNGWIFRRSFEDFCLYLHSKTEDAKNPKESRP